jgi:hypothetical protein
MLPTVTAQNFDQFVSRVLAIGFGEALTGKVFADVAFQHLAEKSSHGAADGGELLEHFAAIFLFIQRPPHPINLSSDAR